MKFRDILFSCKSSKHFHFCKNPPNSFCYCKNVHEIKLGFCKNKFCQAVQRICFCFTCTYVFSKTNIFEKSLRKQIFSHISDKISCIKIFSQKMVPFLHVADKVCLRCKKFKKNVDIFTFFHIFASNFSQKCENDFRDNFRENANTKIFVEALIATCIHIRLRAGGKVEEPIPTKGPRASTYNERP